MNDKAKLLDRVGGEEKLALIVAQFYQYALADDRFNHFWLQNVSDIPKLHDTVTQYFTGKFGGPCTYKGPDMKSLHKNMDIKEADYKIYWEHMYRALRQYKVPEDAIQQIRQMIFMVKPLIVNTPG